MSEPAHADTAPRQFLSVVIGREECAVELAHVREIVRYESVTRVPRVPACVRGVVNLRGGVLPVIDVAIGLGMPAAQASAQSCLLVVEAAIGGERAVLGLLADAVDRVLELLPEDIEPPPSFGTAVPAAWLLGVARLETGFVLLLDIERLLAEGLFRDERGAAEPRPAVRLPGGAVP